MILGIFVSFHLIGREHTSKLYQSIIITMHIISSKLIKVSLIPAKKIVRDHP